MQTTLCVPLEVRPESLGRLSDLIDAFRWDEDQGKGAIGGNFGRISRDVPVLHFMSVSVFPSPDYDPIFVLEANFDGPPGVFWGQIEAAFGARLRAMLRCCKQPLDRDGALYAAVTARESKAPVAPYLEARTQWPSAFHHGNRGLSRDRILAEAALFADLRAELDDPLRHPTDIYRGLAATDVHERLQQALTPAFPWLATPAPERISRLERATDLARLVLFVVILLLVLTMPSFIAASLLDPGPYVQLIILLFGLLVAVVLLVKWLAPPPPDEPGFPSQFRLLAVLWQNAPLIGAVVGGAAVLMTLAMWPIVTLARWVLALLGGTDWPVLAGSFWPMVGHAALGLLGLIVVVPLLVLWVRFLERRDSSQDAPPPYPDVLREMLRQEDWIAQNHMGSVVLIKPGVLRTLVIRAGHLGLGLFLRFSATHGYLGSMRTVHFAHWAFLNNGSRLLFLSNFDQSWGSYLDDFIEKANVGTTLAWGAGVGFPPTRFLIYDGSSNGRRFKAWALASRAVSRFWYSAYPGLTVDQIERNFRIANGLRQHRLTEMEAREWIRDL